MTFFDDRCAATRCGMNGDMQGIMTQQNALLRDVPPNHARPPTVFPRREPHQLLQGR